MNNKQTIYLYELKVLNLIQICAPSNETNKNSGCLLVVVDLLADGVDRWQDW